MSRSDFYGAQFMVESTPGTDPGIIAASFVDGSSEAVDYVADTTYKGFIRLADKPSGLPKFEMKEVPQVYQTNDYDGCIVKGLQSAGEVTLTINIGGVAHESGGRPTPPPWLQLAGSASGAIMGHTAGIGGAVDAVDAAPTSGNAFDVVTGTVAAGLPLAWSAAATTNTIKEIMRPSGVTDANTVADASYNSTQMGFSATPTAGDAIHYPALGVFDTRLEDYSQTFTILLQRPDTDAAIMLLGAQVKGFTISSDVDNFPTIKLTIIYRSWSHYNDNSTLWTTTPTLAEEPDYYSTVWPCPKIVAGGSLWYMDPSDDSVKRNTIDISGLEITWESGLDRYMANTAVEGVGDILVKSKSSLRTKFTLLYNSDWRKFLDAATSSVSNTFPLTYWEGDTIGSNWFFTLASAKLVEDPGFEGDLNGLMSQTVTLGCGKYTGDTGTSDWDGTDVIDSKWTLGGF